MKPYRNITQIYNSALVEVAPGVRIRRPFPGPAGEGPDPFLLLDHFGPKAISPGDREAVPDHPHRGFEPITILFEGKVEHKDSMGNHSFITGGDVQWMTAGSGIIHAEYIGPENEAQGGTINGIQLWVNLPKKEKMTKPGYQNLRKADIPVVEWEKGRARVIAGSFLGTAGPAATFTPIRVLDVYLEAGGSFEAPVEPGFTATAYVVDGEAHFEGQRPAKTGRLAVYDKKGDFAAFSSPEGAHVLFLSGKPLYEPVVSYGPFVMNSRNEILQAVKDFESGKMGTINH